MIMLAKYTTHLSVLTMKIVSCQRPCCSSESVTLPAASSIAYYKRQHGERSHWSDRDDDRIDEDTQITKHVTRNTEHETTTSCLPCTTVLLYLNLVESRTTMAERFRRCSSSMCWNRSMYSGGAWSLAYSGCVSSGRLPTCTAWCGK